MVDDALHSALRDSAARLVEACSSRQLTVSTAESCTAGMVASAIAGIPGASSVLRGGAVTYVNEVKHAVLGVSERSLECYTEVSSQVAEEMADGSRRVFSSDIAVSLTGYAGPGGGTEINPVGTVYIGCSDAFRTSSERCMFAGDRDAVRAQAALRALQLCCERAEAMGNR
ncbi:CinA family protein [Collinsella tanakaei]|uniref:CinA family protein n=1 Tax=Collinsella tanakaei TaxID=626935 RepID=UPI0025A4BE1B|nr:nicotinamide-nucleotide amidohydrolase family protein [Collinsella tanakaei]MDM8299798.1 nicotinamide-nucleotide amidohydrolase family protein [Collinsella tanakaei]